MPEEYIKFLDSDRYVEDAGVAKLICNSAASAYCLYHRNIWNMLAHFGGRLPRNPEVLKAQNSEWMSNVPYGRAFTHIQAETTSRLGMFVSAIAFMLVKLKSRGRKYERSAEQFYYANPLVQESVQYALSDTLVSILLRDPEFMQLLLNYAQNSVSWGYAPSIAQEDSPYPYSGDIRDVLFEPQAKIENVKTAILLWEQSALDVYKTYVEECVEKENPLYDKQAYEDALSYSMTQGKINKNNQWALIYKNASETRGGFRSALGKAKNILWARIINEEKDGSVTVTLYEFSYDYIGIDYRGDNVQGRCGSKIAYQENFSDVTFDEYFGIVRNSGVNVSTLIQQLRGIAPFAYENGVQYDFNRNTANDAMSIHSALKFQPESALQENDFNVQYYGGYMLYPPNYPLMRTDNAAQPLSANIEWMRFSQDEYRQLTGDINPQISDKLKDRATNSQVAQVSNEVLQTKEDNSAIPLFDLSKELKKIFGRIRKEKQKKKFKEVREKLATALEIQVLDVFAPELDITGDKFLDQVIDDLDDVVLDYMTNDAARLLELIRMAPNQTTQMFYRRRYAAALSVSYNEQKTYWPINEDPRVFSSDLTQASLENNAFWTTRELPVIPIENHLTHLEVHLYRAHGHIQSIMQGIDPVEVLTWLQNCLSHSAFHLKELQGDSLNQASFERFSAMWQELSARVPEIERIAQQYAKLINEGRTKQQAQGEMMTPEEQAQIERKNRESENRMNIMKQNNEFRREEKRLDGEQKRRERAEIHEANLVNMGQTTAMKQLEAMQNVRNKENSSSGV